MASHKKVREMELEKKLDVATEANENLEAEKMELERKLNEAEEATDSQVSLVLCLLLHHDNCRALILFMFHLQVIRKRTSSNRYKNTYIDRVAKWGHRGRSCSMLVDHYNSANLRDGGVYAISHPIM
jgi:hypothetical protein